MEFRKLQNMTLKEIEKFANDHEIEVDPELKKEQLVYCVYKMYVEKKYKNVTLSSGYLEILPDGYGFLRTKSYTIAEGDVYVSPSQIKRFNLRTGDFVIGQVRPPKENESYHALLRVEMVNMLDPDKAKRRPNFEKLVPLFPEHKLELEADPKCISTRIMDLITPIGLGQRGLIVAPPKAGKTTLLKEIAYSLTKNHPYLYLIVLLIDERPEEVTDIERSVEGEVAASCFDQPISNHLRVSEMILEKAKRMVEQGANVVILLDSITRLARAYNISVPSSGQTLSGGVNPHALYKPKRFFGSARNIEHGGSLTILATALIETGNKMDDFIFEEFKGTGNMELHLDRELFQKRLFPAINIKQSNTRKEELLVTEESLRKLWVLRRVFNSLSPEESMEIMIKQMNINPSNSEFLDSLNKTNVLAD